jgi:hypothetical protein
MQGSNGRGSAWVSAYHSNDTWLNLPPLQCGYHDGCTRLENGDLEEEGEMEAVEGIGLLTLGRALCLVTYSTA